MKRKVLLCSGIFAAILLVAFVISLSRFQSYEAGLAAPDVGTAIASGQSESEIATELKNHYQFDKGLFERYLNWLLH